MSIGAVGAQGANPYANQPQINWQNVLGAASNALGLSQTALTQQLSSGQSLASIAQSQGVSTSSIISTVAGALTQSGTGAGQAQQIATGLVDRTRGGHHHHHHGAGGASGASGTAALLAALNGDDSSTAQGVAAAGSSDTGSSTGDAASQSGSSLDLLA